MAEALILLDAFPVIAYTPDGGRYEPARVVVFNDKVQVWVVPMGAPGPQVIFESAAMSVSGTRLAGFTIQTPDGDVRTARTSGCGCGSPLKRFDPYEGATRKVKRLERL